MREREEDEAERERWGGRKEGKEVGRRERREKPHKI